MRQEIRFCTASDGTRIAYATMGQGLPLIKVPNWLTHLEQEPDSLLWPHWFEELSREHRFIRYDQRGCGLSDRDVEDISLEAWVSDLEAVMDAAGVDRCPVLALSQGGPVAVEYAARHPERVTQLVLVGTFARLSTVSTTTEFEAIITLVREGWARESSGYPQIFTSRMIPTASQAEVQSFNHLQRVSTTGEIVARTLRAISSIDVADSARSLSVPTLVLHSLDDHATPFSAGRALAALIPGARLVTLNSPNHWLLAGEPAWQTLVSELRAFLASGPLSDAAQAAAGSESGLSQREVEVLRLLAAGKSNQQIADELVISQHTVIRHVSNIFAKIEVENRTEAANFAHRHNLA